MRVLVFGPRGWLGLRYLTYLQAQPGMMALPASCVDICDPKAVLHALTFDNPDLVINAAGKTHSATLPNIDGCVESFEMQSATFHANTVGAGVVAAACQAKGVRLVHLSSGCIYDGSDRVFTEQDPPNPVSWYARTKAMGESLVQQYCPDALILRIRMPISAQPHPRNLITKLVGAKTVIDVENSVTVVEDLLKWTFALVGHGVTGIVHAVHPQPITFRTLLQWYQELVYVNHVTTFISPAQYVTKDGRSNCVLNTRELPIVLADTEVAVRAALRGYAHAMDSGAYDYRQVTDVLVGSTTWSMEVSEWR